MKFKFTVQPYQTEAVESVVGVFAGQPFNDRFTYRRDIEIERDITNYILSDEELTMGFANAKVRLDSVQLLDNIRRMQTRNNIKLTDKLTTSLGACSLDVEMETGTGKTYVYIKTMFELNKQYGWSKFIVVVPSIAIREGVKKSFETMQEHFMEHYGKKARFFIYDSKNLSEIDNFSQNSDISVMIINIQAFNTSFNSEKNKKGRAGDAAARIIFSSRDRFGSRRPIDVIAANHPIIIMDEPQKMGGEKTQKVLKQFNPLFCLNYSATHKEHHELVYVLDALDAYNQQLVKRIEVKGFDIKNLRGTDSYLFLEGIVLSSKKPPMARIEFEIGYDKSINRETRIVSVDDDLFSLSKNMEQYRGYRISDINPFNNTVTFTNGEIIHTGEVVGDISETDLRRVQIRETIRSHFEKEKELFSRGIKTLSLFFIDEVAKYRQYDEDGNEINSLYGEIFEQEYTDILNEYLTLYNTPYEQYLRSIDKKGHKVDSTRGRGKDESDDISAYDLILKDIYRYLIRNDYIDDDDHITQQYRADAANNAFAPLPESFKDIADGVHALIRGIFDEHALDDMVSDGHNTKAPDNALNDNFWKKEFQTLWNYINHKYAYTVEFDSEELIQKAVAHINDKMFVAKLQYTVTAGQQEQTLDYEKIKYGAGFSKEKTKTFTLERGESSSVKYDLIGKIAAGTKLTRRSAARILSSIRPDVFAMYKNNPEEFITKAIRLIDEEKATMIVDHILYNTTDGTYDQNIFTAEKNTDFSKAYRSKKNVQDYVFADGYAKDGKSVERRFAEDMDIAEEVCVYAKLPKGFSIPTPVGNYSPDWAIAFYEGKVKHIYFIAETKGTMDSLNLKPIEKAKIDCAEKLFAQLSGAEVIYERVDSYQSLLNIMNS